MKTAPLSMPAPSLANKHLLLIAHHNSYRLAPYIHTAHRAGMRVTVASESRYSLISEVAAGLHLDFSDHDDALRRILAAHAQQPIHGILGSDDATVELAARAARALSLPHNPPRAAACSQRKDLARAELLLAGCPVPLNCLLDLSQPLQKQMAGLPWPCVVKPLNMSASRGVIRADNEAELLAACERIRAIIAENTDPFTQNHVLVEEYIDGDEIAFDGYLHDGRLHPVALFDKPEPLTGPYFEETIYVTPSRLDAATQGKIMNRIEQACHAYGLRTGMIHAECRIDARDVWVLEIASRTIGGDCGRLLDQGDFSLEELAISLAVGAPVAAPAPTGARGVMMIPVRQRGLLKRVEGQLDARRIAGIDKLDIIIPPGHTLTPLPEGNQYLGYIFASGDNSEAVTRSLQQAYQRLNVVTAPVFNIEPVSV